YLAEAEPDATLALIENTFGQWPIDALKTWEVGRQNVVWTLEKIAVWEHTCLRVVEVLMKMAAAENARNSNNSTGLLNSLFHIFAPTELAAGSRLAFLIDVLRSHDRARRDWGVRLFGQWLDTHGHIRMVGAEYQGMRAPVVFWQPKTYPELWKYLSDAWEALL